MNQGLRHLRISFSMRAMGRHYSTRTNSRWKQGSRMAITIRKTRDIRRLATWSTAKTATSWKVNKFVVIPTNLLTFHDKLIDKFIVGDWKPMSSSGLPWADDDDDDSRTCLVEGTQSVISQKHTETFGDSQGLYSIKLQGSYWIDTKSIPWVTKPRRTNKYLLLSKESAINVLNSTFNSRIDCLNSLPVHGTAMLGECTNCFRALRVCTRNSNGL